MFHNCKYKSQGFLALVLILGVKIPSEFLLMAPYVAAMVVLASVVGRGQLPTAYGQPYK